MKRILSNNHRTGKDEVSKSSLFCLDEKIYIQNNEYEGLALGYQS